jgi:hypothetical protein
MVTGNPDCSGDVGAQVEDSRLAWPTSTLKSREQCLKVLERDFGCLDVGHREVFSRGESDEVLSAIELLSLLYDVRVGRARTASISTR